MFAKKRKTAEADAVICEDIIAKDLLNTRTELDYIFDFPKTVPVLPTTQDADQVLQDCSLPSTSTSINQQSFEIFNLMPTANSNVEYEGIGKCRI